MVMTGWFDNIGEAKVSKTGQYFKPGKYRVRILAVKEVTGQLGGTYTVIETKVLESNNPEIPVGSEKSQVIEMGAKKVMALPNVKAFIAAASGVDGTLENVNDLVEDYWFKLNPMGVRLPFSKIVEELVIKHNALEGVEINLECVEITTREGNPFTRHIWEIRRD
jgi:hypothetical protein